MNREAFIDRGCEALGRIYDAVMKCPAYRLSELDPEKTVLVVIDMVNGFAREGALYSPRIESLIATISSLADACRRSGFAMVAFADSHPASSPEFASYPVHCLAGTSESELVNELKKVGGYSLIPKNSTNGFIEPAFQVWLDAHPHIDTYIVVGDCTDICVQQFVTTAKAYYNMKCVPSRIIVPLNSVDTFDLGDHAGDLTHIMALFNMLTNGVDVAKEVVL